MQVNLTPQEIDANVQKLVNSIAPGSTPIYVDVVPEQNAEINDCFPTVERKVSECGGERILGWQIWKTAFLIEAEFHAVWRSQSGTLLDITPKDLPVSKILFLPDPQARYTGVSRDNIRQSLEKNELVNHFIALAQAQFRIKNRGDRAHQYGEIHLIGEEAQLYEYIEHHKLSLEMMLLSGQNIYSPCFCRGSRSYINCHGNHLIETLERFVKDVV